MEESRFSNSSGDENIDSDDSEELSEFQHKVPITIYNSFIKDRGTQSVTNGS